MAKKNFLFPVVALGALAFLTGAKAQEPEPPPPPPPPPPPVPPTPPGPGPDPGPVIVEPGAALPQLGYEVDEHGVLDFQCDFNSWRQWALDQADPAAAFAVVGFEGDPGFLVEDAAWGPATEAVAVHLATWDLNSDLREGQTDEPWRYILEMVDLACLPKDTWLIYLGTYGTRLRQLGYPARSVQAVRMFQLDYNAVVEFMFANNMTFGSAVVVDNDLGPATRDAIDNARALYPTPEQWDAIVAQAGGGVSY